MPRGSRGADQDPFHLTKEKERVASLVRVELAEASLSPFCSCQPKMCSQPAKLSAAARLQTNLPTWLSLGDAYTSQVLREGFKLPFVEGFDPENPDPNHYPPWTFNKEVLPDQVATLIQESLDNGSISEISFDQVKGSSQIFAIPKKDPGQWRLITNLKNLNPLFENNLF